MTWLYAWAAGKAGWLVVIGALLAAVMFQQVRVSNARAGADRAHTELASYRATQAESARLPSAHAGELNNDGPARPKEWRTMAKRNSTWRAPMLIVLVLLSAGCSSVSPPSSPPSVEPPRIPALPPQGRQPPTPPFCLPTCSAALEKEFGSWESSLTLPTRAAGPVSATPTVYSPPKGKSIPRP